MKTIGLIGGMSWESSSEYYRIINQLVKQKLGKSHSCKCIMYSVDFSEIEPLQNKGQWEELSGIMIDAARGLERAGADFLLVCANTMHKIAEKIQSSISIPLLHIADATAEQVRLKKLKKVGLLGTKFTMGQDFYKSRLQKNSGTEVIVPSDEDQTIIHNIIYSELIQGIIKPESKDKLREIVQRLIEHGVEGIILGCTEIPMLIKQDDIDIPIPVFDTTAIHAEYAITKALGTSGYSRK